MLGLGKRNLRQLEPKLKKRAVELLYLRSPLALSARGRKSKKLLKRRIQQQRRKVSFRCLHLLLKKKNNIQEGISMQRDSASSLKTAWIETSSLCGNSWKTYLVCFIECSLKLPRHSSATKVCCESIKKNKRAILISLRTVSWVQARDALLIRVLSDDDSPVSRTTPLTQGVTWGNLEENGCVLLEPLESDPDYKKKHRNVLLVYLSATVLTTVPLT